jgi:hypothetical protein
MPAAADDPLARLGLPVPVHLGDDLVPGARLGVEALRNSPTPVKCPCPSMKPGIASMPQVMMTLLLGPIQRARCRIPGRRSCRAHRDRLRDGGGGVHGDLAVT